MRIGILIASLAICSCSQAQAVDDHPLSAETAATPARPSPRPGKQSVEVEMSRVDLHVTADITLSVRHLRGRFQPVGNAEIPYLDDKHSYVVAIDSAEIAMDLPSLNATMTQALGQDRSN